MRHETWLTTRLISFPESKVRHVYDVDGLRGYSGHFAPGLVDDIRQRPEVAYVERDQMMQVLDRPYLRPRGLRLSREPISSNPSSSYQRQWHDGFEHPTLEQSMIHALSHWLNKDKRRTSLKSPSKQRGAPWD